MIGSGRSIPWIRLFEGRLRYAVQYDPQSEQWIPEKRPHAGSAGYRVLRDQNGIRETFATVAVVPNLARTGSVLILEGLTTAAAEGALELLTSPDFRAKLKSTEACKAVDLRSGDFELLLRTKPMASAPLATEVLACHALESAAE